MVRSSSIRVSPATRERVGLLASRLNLSSQQEVIEKALDRLEAATFWDGFDAEAAAYLTAFPQESAERKAFGGTSADGIAKPTRRR